MIKWIKAWIGSPRRMWRIWVLGVCPDCKSRLAWGQWNDGAWFGKPFCFNSKCKKDEQQ